MKFLKNPINNRRKICTTNKKNVLIVKFYCVNSGNLINICWMMPSKYIHCQKSNYIFNCQKNKNFLKLNKLDLTSNEKW